MASVRGSARMEEYTAKCGHKVMVEIPPCKPGTLGPVGLRRVAAVQREICWRCMEAERPSIK